MTDIGEDFRAIMGGYVITLLVLGGGLPIALRVYDWLRARRGRKPRHGPDH